MNFGKLKKCSKNEDFQEDTYEDSERRTIKSKDWLEIFNLKESEEPSKEWEKAVVRLGISKKKCKITAELEDKINRVLYIILYLNCDISKEFLP